MKKFQISLSCLLKQTKVFLQRNLANATLVSKNLPSYSFISNIPMEFFNHIIGNF